MQSLILDVQARARSFGETAQATVERAVASTDRRFSVCPTALAIPTQGPMDSFHATTWPACYVEWWFGDGAPGLERDRPMLFEQVAKRLIEIEEHEYVLETDDAPYVASCQSRFDNPEIIAVMGDVVRRLKLLKGTRAAIGRKGFDADLTVLASASSQDFMEAMNIAGPKESIGSALSRPDMPAMIKTALRTLLLSTNEVPGTEGRKKRLRFNGHANNILWGPPSFFSTPNFADAYHPLVKMLHEGPGRHSHLDIRGSASRPATRAAARPPAAGTSLLSEGYLACTEPRMPSLRRMHEFVATDSRAQAKLFPLMSELHYRFPVGVERLHIG